MKKLLLILFAAFLLTGCNNDGDGIFYIYEKFPEEKYPELNMTGGVLSSNGDRIEIVTSNGIGICAEVMDEQESRNAERLPRKAVSDKVWHEVIKCSWFTLTNVYDVSTELYNRIIVEVEPNTTGENRKVPFSIGHKGSYDYIFQSIETDFMQEK